MQPMSQLLKGRGWPRVAAGLLTLATVVVSAAWAGVFHQTGHGDDASGVRRLPTRPTGSCGQCHSEGSGQVRYSEGLWRANDNALCYTCHAVEDGSGTYPGQRVYQTSPHALDSRSVWPGPVPRPRDDLEAAGKCLNCHDPHGAEDRTGPIPGLLISREETLCLSCHDGDPADADVAREMAKPFAHAGRRTRGTHAADEGGDPTRYAYAGGARHASCSDCHNAHASYPDASPPMAPQASRANAWVGRVRVINGGPGAIPAYEYLAPLVESPAPLEYEICFKCHSSWTRQPPGQPDLARLLNPANPSYHPVEGPGNNPGIRPDAFVPGIDASRVIFCGDCHGSDDPDVRGPHGSTYPDLLRRPYDTAPAAALVGPDDLCFQCHDYDTYANPYGAAGDASRFNPPAAAGGHGFHVGEHGVSCHACHDSHGSPEHPALMTTDRFPGLTRFSSTHDGGTCQSTCHDSASYNLNYPR